MQSKYLKKYLWRSSFLVADCQPAAFSRVPWGFYLIKKFVKIVFRRFHSLVKTSGNEIVPISKNELLQRYFSRILTENFPWQLSEQRFIRHLFFQDISVTASELCLAQLDHSLYCLKFPSSVVFTPVIKFNFHNGWFEHRKEVLAS